MAKHLLIVESPAKAKTIEKYLGDDYQVEASMGHIRDLPKGNGAIDTEHDFEPKYEVSSDKREVVNKLKRLAKTAQKVWLATDEDREGEAISWHLLQELGLDLHNTPRIVFHEITKPAIQQAISNPRSLDMNLVHAQQARRVLDRLVGFELSPILWQKLKPGLSAGRVQSVAVRLIVEREREIMDFQSRGFFRVVGTFEVAGKKLQAELKERFDTEAEARAFLEACRTASFVVADVQKKPAKRTPAAPFTTSTLQQEAARKLGYSVAQTMSLAQALYENGHITYMRTDSLNLSETALAASQQAIVQEYGERYHKRRTYKTKTAGAQEAHEAIRPTDLARRALPDMGRNENRLYELIWKRAVASQMADAELEKTTITVDIQGAGSQPQLQATGEVITFDGFMKLYLEHKDEEEESETQGLLPPLQVGQVLQLEQLTATERFTRASARYNEASLVKKLEELGIGRPSTYAPTISTIQKREYVVKENREGTVRSYQELTLAQGQVKQQQKTENTGAEKMKLFPTDLGMLVTDFLVEYFPDVFDYSFTAKVEQDFDHIATGGVQWNEMIRRFYGPFHERVNVTKASANRATGERELGVDPQTGKPLLVRMGKYGPLVQIGEGDDPEKRFASLQKNQRLETITFAEALDLFRLPRTVGTYEGKDVVAAIGRFGPYIRHNSKFVSIPKDLSPLEITPEQAIALIDAKRQADSERLVKDFSEQNGVQVLKGRYGIYLAYSGKNYKIPKDEQIEAITPERAMEIIQSQPEPRGRGRAAAKADKKAPEATKSSKKPAKAPAKAARKKTAQSPRSKKK
ncbi:MAG: type I DNA topoisomerase [Bacteroidetes bacterium]|nr:type I DNA topoisomerase [Bacteroidota bacterium]